MNKILGLIFASITLVIPIEKSCSEDLGTDWAGVIEDFVDKKVPLLTEAYARADLNKRWLDAFSAPFSSVSMLQEDIVRRAAIPGFKLPERLDLSTAIESITLVQLKLASIRYDQARLEELEMELTNLALSCNNPNVVGNMAISSLGGLAIGNVSLPNGPQYIIMWDPTWYSTIASIIYDAYAFFDDDSKRKRAQSAIDRLPSKLIQPHRVGEISKEICESSYFERKESIVNYVQSVRLFESRLRVSENYYWGAYKHIEAYLSSATYYDVLEKAGILRLEVEQSQNRASAKLLLDLEIARNEIRLLEVSAIGGNSCRSSIADIEYYEDALIELEMQINALQRVFQLSETLTRLTEIHHEVIYKKGLLAKIYQQARSKKC